jgi:regulatory protein
MHITSIKQQVKNAERASIFIDGKYGFSLSLNELVSKKLKIGAELDEKELKRLKKLSEDGKLSMRALEWAMSRPRSNKEFRNYLYRKQADPALIEKLILEFTSKDYLNEQRFAAWLTDVRRRRGKSERAIRAELSSKGVEHAAILEVLDGGGDEQARLQLIAAKKAGLSRYKNDPDKLMRYLIAQGFMYSDVKLALQAINSLPE